MSGSPPYSVGIDPGYGEAGIVLRRGPDVLEFGLVSDEYGHGFPTVFRSQAVAACLIGKLIGWIGEHGIVELDIAIERPIYNQHPENFAKQYTQVQALQALVCSEVAPLLKTCWISEPNPSESKKLATGEGDAGKPEMLQMSPFATMGLVADLRLQSRWTLADAWAHSLATWGAVPRRFRADQIKWPMPQKGE